MNIIQSIKKKHPHLSNRQIRSLVKQGLVGKKAELPREYLSTQLMPNPTLGCELVKMTEDFIFLSKPAGVPSVALSVAEKNSVANWLLSVDENLRHVSTPLESGLLHRLDNETSGLMLAARHKKAWNYLRKNWSLVIKEYVCLVTNDPPESPVFERLGSKSKKKVEPAVYEAWFPPRNKNRKKVLLNSHQTSSDDQLVQTKIVNHQKTEQGWWLTVELVTGCRHQIRAHLSQMECPLLGDEIYGGQKADRLYLHASRISFTDHNEKNWDVILRFPKLQDK